MTEDEKEEICKNLLEITERFYKFKKDRLNIHKIESENFLDQTKLEILKNTPKCIQDMKISDMDKNAIESAIMNGIYKFFWS